MKQILASLAPLLKRLPSLRYGDRLRPERDWLVLIALTLVGIALGVLIGLVTFFSATHEMVEEKTQVDTATTSPDASEMLSNSLREREQEALKFRSGYEFVDPSR